jgi:hypothetical protein
VTRAAGAYAPPRPAPEPFYVEQPAPVVRPQSSYVTAHLAALARERAAADADAVLHEPPPRREPQPRFDFQEPQPRFDFQELLPREHAPPRVPPGARPSERRTVAGGAGSRSHSRARAGVERSLRRFGIGEELARELLDGTLAHTVPLVPRAGLAHAARATLAQRMPVAPPLPTKGAAIVLIGTGGSGKTTCCAAMLGAYRRASVLPAGYASVLRADDSDELQLLLSPQLVKPVSASSARAVRALKKVREAGVVILDTPALSPANRAQIRELARLLGQIKPERVVVALPATLGAVAAAQLLGALAPLGANALAVTHADETDQVGVAVEAACRFKLAPEYVLDRTTPTRAAASWRLRRVDPAELAARVLP